MKPLAIAIQSLLGSALLLGCATPATPVREVKPTLAVRGGTVEAADYYALGRHYQTQGRLPQAIDAFRKALARNDRLVEARNALGTIHASLGDFDRAIAEFNAAIAIDPQAAHLYNNLGYALHLQRRDAEAVEAYGKAAALDSSNPRTWNNLASALARLGDAGRADEAFARARDLAAAPSPARPPANLAISGTLDGAAPSVVEAPPAPSRSASGVITVSPVPLMPAPASAPVEPTAVAGPAPIVPVPLVLSGEQPAPSVALQSIALVPVGPSNEPFVPGTIAAALSQPVPAASEPVRLVAVPNVAHELTILMHRAEVPIRLAPIAPLIVRTPLPMTTESGKVAAALLAPLALSDEVESIVPVPIATERTEGPSIAVPLEPVALPAAKTTILAGRFAAGPIVESPARAAQPPTSTAQASAVETVATTTSIASANPPRAIVALEPVLPLVASALRLEEIPATIVSEFPAGAEIVPIGSGVVELRWTGTQVLARPAKAVDEATPTPFGFEVVNGNGATGMARRLAGMLAAIGMPRARLANQKPFEQPLTVIQYREGRRNEALDLSASLPNRPPVLPFGPLRPGIDIRLVLGHDLPPNVALVAPAARRSLRADAGLITTQRPK